MHTNKFEILIVSHQLKLITRSISKIISSTLNRSAHLVNYDEIKNELFEFSPKLLIVDQTLLNKENSNLIYDYNKMFPKVKILIITLDESFKIDDNLIGIKEIEVLNLWQNNPSSTKNLLVLVKDKLLNLMELGDGEY